ncbi:MAG: hypothetical protein KDA25_07020, partial [Phycisphaerales bacterium]|nr:hypothetical protein [Phycisphaerales bacterium]
MSRRERFVIHGLLILLVLGMLPNLVGLTTGEAIAAASRWVADLGPAESVTLVDPGGGDDVVLRNREGHAAWGDDAFHRAHAIAFVHISKVLNRLLQAEAMTDERDALREAAEEEDAGFRRRFEAFEREHADITPEDPQAEAVFNRYRELRNE